MKHILLIILTVVIQLGLIYAVVINDAMFAAVLAAMWAGLAMAYASDHNHSRSGVHINQITVAHPSVFKVGEKIMVGDDLHLILGKADQTLYVVKL